MVGALNFWRFLSGCVPNQVIVSVSQTCSNEGMEFTLRTPDGFRGRIYTYKHYDRPHCYIRGMSRVTELTLTFIFFMVHHVPSRIPLLRIGNGGRNNVLRIPGAAGYPDCGTEQVTCVLRVIPWSGNALPN